MKKHNSKKNNRPAKVQRDQEYRVTQDTELLPFLFSVLANKSKNSVKSILTRGQVEINGVSTTQHNAKLVSGDCITIKSNQSSKRDRSLVGMTVLHEDEDVIVIDKQAGLLSVATDGGHELTAHNQLMHYVKSERPTNRIYIVHRLDKDTSGVMLFARSESVKKKLQDHWKDTVEERIYTAVVEGEVKKKTGKIHSYLIESKAFKMHSTPFDNGGKEAITHYKVLQVGKHYSLIQLHLETGRKNQIRVHMESIGHPIVGDKKYGAQSNPLKRLGLHATTLTFIHPTTGERLTFKSSFPKSFKSVLKK